MDQFKNQKLLEKYTNFKQLGQGAISGIYYAESVVDQQPVAIKVVTKKRIQDQEQNRYFQQELDVTKAIMAQGKNENIVNILELIEGEDEYFIVTEYYQDGDLLNLLERFSFKFSPEVALSFCIAIASGLNFLHKGKICHRDLKPENILIAKQSDGNFFIKISDFGISKQSEEMMKSTIGTITYMAPEILKFQSYNEKVDIWGFGCLVYEIFVGEQLFGGRSMKEVALKITGFNEDMLDQKQDKIPLPVIKLIKKCLKRLPERRISLDDAIKELIQIRAEMKVNMAQSILVSQNNSPAHHPQNQNVNQIANQNKVKSVNLESTVSENSVQIVQAQSSQSIKFTDNLNESFDNYIEEVQDEKKVEQQEIPLVLTQAMSQLEGEEELNYITPKNNVAILHNNEKIKSNHSIDSDSKLKILEEDQKNKKIEDKTKHNELLLGLQQENTPQQIKPLIKIQQQQKHQPKEQEVKSDIEESVVLEKTQNPNYQAQLAQLMTPQPNKTSASNIQTTSFLSEQKTNDVKPVEQIKIQHNPISNFNQNLYAKTDNGLKQDHSPTQYTSPFKIPNPMDTQLYNIQTKATPIKDISLGEPQAPILSALTSATANLSLQSQTPSTNTSYLTNYQSPSKTLYPYSAASQGTQASPYYQKSNSNIITDQISQNNASSELQSILNMYTSTKIKPKQKIEFKVEQHDDKDELTRIQVKFATIMDADKQFKIDQVGSKYKFENVQFIEIMQTLPCALIENLDDGYILEFLSFIHTNIHEYKPNQDTLLKKYINAILLNQESYFQISNDLKKNSNLLYPFFKVIIDIVELKGSDIDYKYHKLYEMTKSSKFLEFLKIFGNLLQTFKFTQQTKTLYIDNSMKLKDFDDFNYHVKHKIPFKISKSNMKGVQQYFVHFNH